MESRGMGLGSKGRFSIPRRPRQFRSPIETPRMLAEAPTDLEIPIVTTWYDALGRDSEGEWRACADLPTLLIPNVSFASRRLLEVEKITPIPPILVSPYETEEMPVVEPVERQSKKESSFFRWFEKMLAIFF